MNVVQIVDGLPIPTFFKEENYYLMKNLPARTNDTIILTYPKCGTNWVAYITWGILHPQEPAPEASRVQYDIPLVEFWGLSVWEGSAEDQSRTVMTHLAPDRLRMSANVKYIFVIRNPLDCCASFYYFWKKLIQEKSYGVDPDYYENQLTPGVFFDHFMKGETPYGDFFPHLKSCYELRNQENVHLIIFEKLKANPREEIMRLASYLGQDKALLENDGKLLDKIVEQSSFTVMKTNLKYTNPVTKEKFALLRTGIVGGYRNTFTPQQIESLRNKMEQELAGTEILEIWRDV